MSSLFKDEWFKFGLVRCFIGWIVSAILGGPIISIGGSESTATTTTTGLLISTTTPTLRAAQILSGDDWVWLILILLVLFVPLSFLLCGIQYYIGSRILRRSELKPKGIWGAVSSGVVGFAVLVALLLIATVIFSAVSGIEPDVVLPVIGLGVILLTFGLVYEGFIAIITWFVYPYLELERPSL